MAAQDTKAVIFDCFGVLYIDYTTSLIAEATGEKRRELSDIFMSNNYGYFNRQEYLERVAEVMGMSVTQVAEYMAREHRLNTPLVSLIIDQIKPKYKVGLLSNIGREWIDDFFSKHQLHELFDEVVLSGEEGIAKPHPAIFELMASRLGLHISECLMIDDIEDNCEGAEIAGMQTIHYTSNEGLLEELYKRGIA